MIRNWPQRLALALLAATLVTPNAWSEDPQPTVWKGTLKAGPRNLRLEIAIRYEDGKPRGVLTSVDQNNIKLPADAVELTQSILRFKIPRANASYDGKLSKDGKSAEGTFQQNGAKLPLTLTKADAKPPVKETLREAWYGKLDLKIHEPIMQFRIVTVPSGKSKAYFDSVTENLMDFPATWKIEGDSLHFDVTRPRIQYRGKLNKNRDTAVGTWTKGDMKFPLTLKKHDAAFKNVNLWKNRPQRPRGPFPYEALEVTFPNRRDKLTLAGTLTVPKKPGRHPAVILISGSGPQDRDETLMEHKPFLVLADYLTRRGIAVLRYDDRGTAKSTGKFKSATTADFAHDASAAVEFLKSHPRIRPTQIGLAGHSEGGLVAPMVAGMRSDVAFVVLLAATGVDGEAISLSQSEAMLRAAGTSETEIKTALKISKAVLRITREAKSADELGKELEEAVAAVVKELPESEREATAKELSDQMPLIKRNIQDPWRQFFLSYDPRPALRNIECPVLAIIGTKDIQVLPKLNMPEIKKALQEGKTKDFQTRELAGLNHLFQKCKTGAISEYVNIQETFNPLALQVVGDWIVKRVSK